MKKLLRPIDILLLGLTGALDAYQNLKDPFGIVGNAYKNVYGWVPRKYKKTNYYQTIRYGLKVGYIEKIVKNGEPYLQLTANGKERSKRDFPITGLQNKRWDGRWRVVIFDIKEKARRQRDQLRFKLRELGFGMIQESVWISPHDFIVDLREFIESVGLGESVFVMEVHQLLAGDPKTLSAKIWSLERINNEYKELFEDLKKFHDREQILTLKGRYLEILREDPCLPKELLPEDWYGERTRLFLRKKR